jgi:hypothetical protein
MAAAQDEQSNTPLQKRLAKCRQGLESHLDMRIKRCFFPPIY